MHDTSTKPDFLLRGVPAPLVATAERQGVTVRLHTNDAALRDTFLGDAGTTDSVATYVWTLLAERGATAQWSEPRLITTGAVSCVTFGQYAWFAVDFERRAVVGFVPAQSSSELLRLYLDEFWATVASPAWTACG